MLDRIYDFEEFGPAFVRTTSKTCISEHPIIHYYYISICMHVQCSGSVSGGGSDG